MNERKRERTKKEKINCINIIFLKEVTFDLLMKLLKSKLKVFLTK